MISPKIAHSISPKIFPQDFPARISCKNFPQDCLKAYTNDQYIWHKNNIAQLYFILGTVELHWNFSS